MNDAVSRFGNIVRPWLASYRLLNVSVVGVRETGDELILAARISLLPSWLPCPRPDQLESRVLWARSEIIEFDREEFSRVLVDLDQGIIRLGTFNCQLPVDQQTTQGQTRFYPGLVSSFDRDPDAPRIPTLQKLGGSKSTLLYRLFDSDEFDWHLRTLNPPFVDLIEIQQRYGVAAVRFADQTVIEFSVHPPIEIQQTSALQGGLLTLHMSMTAEMDKSKIALGYISSAPDVRGVIPDNLIVWQDEQYALLGKSQVELPGAAKVTCFLTYAGTAVQQISIVDKNRVSNKQTAAYFAFDEDFDHLRGLLFDPKKDRDGRRFEDGVALSLHMLGFNVSQHGRSQKLTDGPDILAYTPKGVVVVVECTTGMPDEDDQVAAVKKRVARIENSMEAAGWTNAKLQPVVVTPLSNKEIAEHREEAEKKGVLVFCREDLEEALIQIRSPQDADAFLEQKQSALRDANILRLR